MTGVLLLALLFVLQSPTQVGRPAAQNTNQIVTPCAVSSDLEACKGGANGSMGTFRLNGKIVVDKGEKPLVDVRLLDNTGAVIKSVLSFASGAFHFDGVSLGRYSVEVVDSRFKLATVPLWLREPEETSNEIVVTLVRNDGAKPSPESAEADRINIKELELDATLPSAALEEFKKGVEAIRSRSKADGYFKKSVDLAPGFYEGHFQLGLELARQRRGPEAIQAMERAAILKPVAPAPLSTLGRLYVEGGEFQKGANTLLKIGSLGPLRADDRYFLGVAFYKLDNTVAAQQQFEQAIVLAPDKNPGAYVQLSYALQRNGNPAAALTALESYLRLFPTDPNHKAVEEGAKRLRATLSKPPG